MVTGLKDGWLIIKWSRFFHSIGFTQVDPDKPMKWSDFIINQLGKDSFNKDKDEL